MNGDNSAVGQILEQYRSFQECLLKELRLSQFGISLELDLEYIWDDNDPSRAALATTPKTVTLAFDLVHEVRIVSALPTAIRVEPARANWGLTEIGRIRSISPSESDRAVSASANHVVVEWEGDRRIDVVFERLRVAAISIQPQSEVVASDE